MINRRGVRGALIVATLTAGFVGCGGDPGAAGAKGDPGAKGDKGDPGSSVPSVSAVTPTSVFLARTIDVTVSGSGTAWTDTTTVDFGPKIKVESLVTASPTALVATITVADDAAMGPRDVKVTADGADQVFKGAFTVESPLKIAVAGSAAQGSVFYVHARGLDFTTPFDTTSTGDGFFTPLVYTNIDVTQVPGVSTTLEALTDYTAELRVITDLDTAAGPKDVFLQSGPAADFVNFPHAGAFQVAERKPTPLVAGTPGTMTIAKPADSALFSYAPADVAIRIIDVSFSADDPDATPAAYFLPKSGKFQDFFGAGTAKTFVSSNTDPTYVIALDASPSYGGYTAKVKLTALAATSTPEKEPNDSKVLAIGNGPLPLPAVTIAASLGDASDVDWYAVTVGAADVGKVIHAQTTGLDPLTDTVIDILQTQGNGLVSIGPGGNPSNDSVYLDELTSAPTDQAGTYFVKVYASTYLDVAHTSYDLVIRLE